MKIKIINKIAESTLDFDDETGAKMVKAIMNCIQSPNEYQSITYNDTKDTIIFTAEYLKHSLIIIPKETN